MTKKMKFTSLVFIATLLFVACSKNDPEVPNEEELITTVTYTLTPETGNTVVLTWKDLDGDGGTNPAITQGTLAVNTVYTGALTLSNDAETPAENITEEIEEEDKEHQFFFQSTVLDLTIVYNDTDADGNPVGLSSKLTTGAAASGSITITLRHEPVKTASGVSGGDITNAGGETDIEVTFPINVQ